jgi:hypothetical protein
VTTETRDVLHRLVDRLPAREIQVARRFLEFLVSGPTGVEAEQPLHSLGDAPEEDEELSEAEQMALADALARRARGEARYVAHEDVRRELG